MAYFDDPTHKAQWEKELAALRAEKQRRIESGITREKRSAAVRENSVKLPSFEELVRRAAGRYAEKGKPATAAVSQNKQPEHTSAAAPGNSRVRMTFSQLLAEEENSHRRTSAVSDREKQRALEAGNAL